MKGLAAVVALAALAALASGARSSRSAVASPRDPRSPAPCANATRGKVLAVQGAEAGDDFDDVSEPLGNTTAASSAPGDTEDDTFQMPDAKALEEMRKEFSAAWAASSTEQDIVALANSTSGGRGYDMEAILDLPIAGFSGCSAPYEGNIYLPKRAAGRAPLISFAHGFTEGGKRLDRLMRRRVFQQLVGMGFVVVAHQTGGLHDYCDSSHDQLHMIDWARNSPYAQMIDFSQVVLMGYSMGGRAALKNAADAALMAKYNVRAVSVFFPHCDFGCRRPVRPVPVHFITGKLDRIAYWRHSYNTYSRTRTDKTFERLQWISHVPPIPIWQRVVTPLIMEFLECTVLGDQQACTYADGSYESCTYGCQNCGCKLCEPCVPCWGSSPPSFCSGECAKCGPCKNCEECVECRRRGQ